MPPSGVGRSCSDCKENCVVRTHTIASWPRTDEFLTEGLKPVPVPPYLFRNPLIHRVSLASVKNSLYRPDLPSLRRMDMDDRLEKMADEHSRTSTLYSKEEFLEAKQSKMTLPYDRIDDQLFSFMEKEVEKRSYNFARWMDEYQKEWDEFLSTDRTVTPLVLKRKDLDFAGYSVRRERPELTRMWQHSIMTNADEQTTGERPSAKDICKKYRPPLVNVIYDDDRHVPPHLKSPQAKRRLLSTPLR